MGIFLAYLLAAVLTALGLHSLAGLARGHDLALLLVTWLTVAAYIGLAAGLLYTVHRYVKRKW